MGEFGCWKKCITVITIIVEHERLTRVPRVREVWSLNLRLAKSYTALQTVRHRFNIYPSSCVVLAL